MFDDKTLLITGGTGSFGNAVLRRFMTSGLRRDEKKQLKAPANPGMPNPCVQQAE